MSSTTTISKHPEEANAAKKEMERVRAMVAKLQKDLEKKTEEDDAEIAKAEKEAEEEEAKMREIQKQYEEHQDSNVKMPKKELEGLKAKAEEMEKLVKYLKKENDRMKSEMEKMDQDLDKMRETNGKLVEANSSAGASLETLNAQAKVLEDYNEKLEAGIAKSKKENKKLEQDLKGRQAFVEAETTVRADYEQALEQIVKIMETDCKDSDLVQKVMTAQLKCVQSIASGSPTAES